MMLAVAYLAVAVAITTLANAHPMGAVQRGRSNLEPRAKSYSVINVDGGSTAAPEPSSTVDDSTKTEVETLKVTQTPAVVTDTITLRTATPTKPTATPAPAPASTSSSAGAASSASESKLSSTSQAQATTSPALSSTAHPTPSVVTVIVTETKSPAAVSTEYYDDGQWHTRYIVKTFEDAAVATAAPSSISSTKLSSVVPAQALPTLDSAAASQFNHTQTPS